MYDIPIDIINFGVFCDQANFDDSPKADGLIHLKHIRWADPNEALTIWVLVVDENNNPVANVPVAFNFSTANRYSLTQEFKWTPRPPHKAHIVRTDGAGMADMTLGREGIVKDGELGGVRCYVLHPDYACDIVSGLGMKPDHTGLVLTFQLHRTGVLPLDERLAEIEARLTALEGLWGE